MILSKKALANCDLQTAQVEFLAARSRALVADSRILKTGSDAVSRCSLWS